MSSEVCRESRDITVMIKRVIEVKRIQMINRDLDHITSLLWEKWEYPPPPMTKRHNIQFLLMYFWAFGTQYIILHMLNHFLNC